MKTFKSYSSRAELPTLINVHNSFKYQKLVGLSLLESVVVEGYLESKLVYLKAHALAISNALKVPTMPQKR
jgi:hypothetical protein